MLRYTDKVRVEKILVAASGTVIEPTGQALYDANGNSNLANGQVGFYNAATNTSFVGAGATMPKFFIAQGRDTSNDPPQLPYKPIEKSEVIDITNGVVFAGEICVIPTNHAWALTSINLNDEATYETRISFSGRRSDVYNGRNTPTIYGSFTAPNYTDEIAAGTYASTAAARDHLVQNIVADLQAQGSHSTHAPSVIAIALDTADAGAATDTVADLAAATVGDKFTIGWTSGELALPIQLTMTEALIQTFADGVTNGDWAGTEGVVPVVVTTTAATASGLDIAGAGTINADQIVLIAPDVRLAAHDKVKQVKERITVGLVSGYNTSTVGKAEVGVPQEEKGGGRNWQLFYEATDGLRKFESTIPGLDGQRIDYPSDIDQTARYASFMFFHNSRGMASNGLQSESHYVTIVLVPCCDGVLKDAIELICNTFVTNFPGFAETHDGSAINLGECPEGDD